jgi:general secretion pathway protein J
LIAIFILATVLSTVFASYTGTLRVVRETESRAEIYQMARTAFERILEDLESAYMPEKSKASESEDTEEPFEFANASLRFPSRAHLVFGEENQPWRTTEISYYVEEADGGEGLILYRRDRPQWEEVPEEGGGGLPLCERLVSVNFTYVDAEGEENEDWDPESEEDMPKIVSVVLQFMNPSNPEMSLKFATSVALRVSEVNEEEG